MRRSDREVTDCAEIIKIIEKCEVCRLALSDNNAPYIVPMNFGFKYTDDKLVLYFHSAKTGTKLDIIARNNLACFEMDCSHRFIEKEEACGCTMEYESVIGVGEIHMCTEESEKQEALQCLMSHYVKNKTFTFPSHALDSIAIFKLAASSFTGKRLVTT